MVARIAGFVTRDMWGARRPRSVSHNITPSAGGTAFHHGGVGKPPTSHAGCYARVRDWQAFHMDKRGWVDIAYSVLPCQHGYVFAGRGFGVRTAANGTDDGNDRFLAACWVGGGGVPLTRAALDAFEWVTFENRRLGAGDEVRPHDYFKSTACPDAALTAHAARLHARPILEGDDMPLNQDDRELIREELRGLLSMHVPDPVPGGKPLRVNYLLHNTRAAAGLAAARVTDADALAEAIVARLPDPTQVTAADLARELLVQLAAAPKE